MAPLLFGLRHSLRWRIPASFGILIVLILASFSWATYGEVKRALVGAGEERAKAAAGEVAGTLSRSMAFVSAQTGRIGEEPSLRAYLMNPSASNRTAAGEALQGTMSPGVRRSELWDASGSLVLDIATSAPDSAPGIATYPAGAPPTYVGASTIRAAGDQHYFDVVAEIRDDGAPGAPVLGHLRRFARFTASAGTPIQRLLGDAAVLKVGTAAGEVWTDFATVVDPPPRAVPGGAPGEFRAAGGDYWVGSGVPIEGTGWRVWVGYPRAEILAPIRPFLVRMVAIALILVAGSTAAAAFLGGGLTRPLRALAEATEEIAAGDYSRRVRPGRSDEIGRLGTSFNRMTDRVQEAHEELKASHERTHFALAAAGIGVWESSLGEDLIRCSDSMRLVHRTAVEDLPRDREAFLAPVQRQDRDALRSILSGHLEDEAFDLMYHVRWPDGSVHRVEGKGRVTRDAAGIPTSILGVSIDVTERHRLETQLAQSQKMEAVGQLAGGVAHDFNNLLTAIVGHGNLILAELPEHEPAREGIGEMLRAADSAAALTRQLLTFSRRQVIQPRVVDVNDVVVRASQLLGRIIGENIELSRHLSRNLPPVKLDPVQLEQIIMNLALNARDAMPDGGSLAIRTGVVDLEEPPSGPAALAAGRYVTLTVTDTGVGMDTETQAHLFEPFFTTKEPGKGTGLGLATVFGIVNQGGGRIEVRSEPGLGAVFSILLPATADRPSPAPLSPALSGGASPPGGMERILVVEDYGPVRAIARTVLRRIGYDVVAVSNGEEALATLASTGVRPDLVLSDVVMPGMTGPELCRRIEEAHPGVRVLFTSGHSGAELDRHGVQEANMMFLEKPYTPAALAAKVREVLGAPGHQSV